MRRSLRELAAGSFGAKVLGDAAIKFPSALSLVASIMLAAIAIPLASATTYAERAASVFQAEPAAFNSPPPGYRETRTSISWGFDGVRSECWVERPTRNPALRGICMTLYGKRSCY